MIEIKILIDDIDYDSLADTIAPVIKDRLDSGELPSWAKLLFMAGGMNGEAVKKILHRIPDDKKEQLIVKLLSGKGEDAAMLFEDLLRTQGIVLKIKDVEASVK